MNRELDLLMDTINALLRDWKHLKEQAPDLTAYAYERKTSGDEKVSGGERDYALDSVGNGRAKSIVRDLRKEAERCAIDVNALRARTDNLFMAGPSADPELRGSLISRKEHKEAIARQKRAAQDGEYVPVRLEEQPSYPRRGTR